MNMKRILGLLLAVLVAGCTSSQPPAKSGIVLGVKHGRKRDCGHGFYTVTVRTEMHPDHWEKYHWGSRLYYKGKMLDEHASDAEVSPSGRYAVYESPQHVGIVLFDSQTGTKYRVFERGTYPMVKKWSKKEDIFTVEYFLSGDETKTVRVVVRNLHPLGEKEAEPSAAPLPSEGAPSEGR